MNGTIQRLIEERATKSINDKLVEINARVVPLTPVGKSRHAVDENHEGYTGSNLRKHWDIIPARRVGNEIVGYIYNNTHYASHVNYGHRTRLGTGKKYNFTSLYYPDGTKKKAYVKGQYFLEKALRQSGIKISNKARFKKK